LTRGFACCLLAALTACCQAQDRSDSPPVSQNSQLNRRIEVLVRSQFEIPSEVSVSIGTPAKSDFSGYENLPITFSGKGQSTTVIFLLSNDSTTIVRLEKFDISHDPADRVPTQGRPVRGNPNAKVTIVGFDDLECPFCAQMHAELFPATAERYKGLVKFVYKDYPLVQIHPWAMHAAVDANCLAEESGAAYWDFVDYAHAHATEITGPAHDVKRSLDALDNQAREEAKRSNLNLTGLASCIAKQDESAIRAEVNQGDALGVNGVTPTVFINGERLTGALPSQTIWMAIDRALKAAGVQPPPEAGADAPTSTTDKPR
jgi:protein-disulfide isomerase